MNIFYSVDDLPKFKNPIVTIGTFDGVHKGHQQILNQLKFEAQKVEGETVLITFHPHPRNIVGDTSGVQLLTTLQEKLSLLAKADIDNVIVIDFNDNFSTLSANDFIEKFLYQYIKPHTIIIGYDHRFGKERLGNYSLLEAMGHKLNFWVKQIEPQLLQEAAISSTRIRKSILQHDINTATELLGYHYKFEGVVIEGDKIGRTIGYPTANLQLIETDKLVPGDGIYAVKVELKNATNLTNKNFKGMMYIGSRPVVNGKRRVIEVNIFDFDEDIYDKIVEVEVVAYIRGELPLNGLEALKNQLHSDREQSKLLLN
ncbi:MAG: bifunctional riboflavin kinase/FAD synthetase [Chitinophagaceae bacterium]